MDNSHRARPLAVVMLAAAATIGSAPARAAKATSSPRALLVGSWHGRRGHFTTIQSAVDSAQPGDWILIGAGDFHERATATAGVLITKPAIHLRGMDRAATVVDGTLSGHRPCDGASGAQDLGPVGSDGRPGGRNGIEVLAAAPGSADGVTIENLTVCNYLASASGGRGNEIWFNGGDGTGHQWLGAFSASYLTATSTYSDAVRSPGGMYGLFVSNTHGPGFLAHSYANNMADAAIYVGACPDCNVVLDQVHGEHSAVGYSGTNSGGHLIIMSSEFNDNLTGIAPTSFNDEDAPSPQDGACPAGAAPPTEFRTCTVIKDNYVHDNNDPDVPRSGIAGAAPTGTGIYISGGRNDTVTHNVVRHNGLFGIVITDYPDTESPPPVANCAGGIQLPGVCTFRASGNEVAANVLDGNGFFGNPGNADLAVGSASVMPGNCFHGNTSPSGEPSSAPPAIQTLDGRCDSPALGESAPGVQIACAGGFLSLVLGVPVTCPGMHYPTPTRTTLIPVPTLPTMPDACAGVPDNPWCRGT